MVFYIQTGFAMEEHLDADGNMKQTNFFQPLEDPRNDSSPYLAINIDRVTGRSHSFEVNLTLHRPCH